MNVEALAIPEVLLITCRLFRDDRGHLFESWRDSSYASLGIGPFVQDNVSVSRRGVLRGMHLQHPHGQGKLAYPLRGTVLDVAADLRRGSPTFRRWVSAELSSEAGSQLYIPAGFAHGFVTLSDDVVFCYKCTDYYAPAAERSVHWRDPSLAIRWPIDDPVLSLKDAQAPTLDAISPELLPVYRSADA